MATITNNMDGTLTVKLSDIETQTVLMMQDDALAQYLTLWIQEKAKQLFNDRFAQLTPEDQALVLSKFAGR